MYTARYIWRQHKGFDTHQGDSSISIHAFACMYSVCCHISDEQLLLPGPAPPALSLQERIDFSPHPKTLTMAGDYEYFAAQAMPSLASFACFFKWHAQHSNHAFLLLTLMVQ